MPDDPQPLPVVCVVLESEDHVFVAQRPPDKVLPLQWEFPGGKVEPGETPEDALHREIREELGCELEIIRPLPVVIHAYPRITIALHGFVARLAAGSPEPCPTEHVAIRWVPVDKLRDLELAAADGPVLAHYLVN